MTRVCQSKRLMVGDPVFPSRPAPSHSGLPLHCRLVTSQEGDIVRERDKLIDIQSASGGVLKDVFGLLRPAEIYMIDRQIIIPDSIIRVQFDGSPSFGQRL